jgi:DNA-binding transcriptional regulator YdaS (Cro superfamily)
MNADEVRNMLRRACQAAGSAAAWAKDNGVSPAYVSDTLNKRRDPGPAILDALGIEAETNYRKSK